MKSSKIWRAVSAMALAGACVAGLSACSQGASSQSASFTPTNLVAATVNGTEISEDTVTAYIQNFRMAEAMDTEDAWGQWLAQYNMEPSTVREDVINYYTSMELIKEAAAEKGVEVTPEEVDTQVSGMKARYTDDEAWNTALEQAGTTEEQYRESVTIAMLESKLQEKVSEETDGTLSDEELLGQVSMYAQYFSGAKRTSHVLFDLEDKETAEQVLEQIKSGELSIADAAAQYSIDEVSAAKGGDVGWDMLNNFVTEYTDGIANLSQGDVSDLVESQHGYHIIQVTEEYTAPETVTSLDQVPTELVDYIRTMTESSKQSSAYTTWFEEYREGADIVINEMPEGLPYDIDMTPYLAELEAEASSDATATVVGEGERCWFIF